MRKYHWYVFLIWMSCISTGWANITIENAWARASAGPNAALFMTIVNVADVNKTLEGAQIGACERTELHNHIENAGIFRMVEVKGIEVPAKGKIDLKPGGYHLMLMKLKRPLLEGKTVSVSLLFKDGKVIDITVPVKADGVLHCCDGS